ncbi:hypothetical protein TVAGG3_0134560 [Trichomonas vaginalis G3]|uniref:hypothetical protein n=1 Tax=Trichomonas vaginalis (strain ATCC PRA-98 / G3) TaxID=412133 RepID=UPI0021E5AC36|nr:hypothetical protein TVAGG3_0134560 [Trichomonas vaginalis G3]KAI5546309.1 hypothetical protein TVAGG3_0134560 [Trichomonas vaginalis G3]
MNAEASVVNNIAQRRTMFAVWRNTKSGNALKEMEFIQGRIRDFETKIEDLQFATDCKDRENERLRSLASDIYVQHLNMLDYMEQNDIQIPL